MENHYVTLWSVDTKKFVNFSCSYLKQYEMKKQLMYGRINIHNLIKNNNKIYALPDFANFIWCFDLFNDGFTVACESFDHIYGLSNTIYNDAIYYSASRHNDQVIKNPNREIIRNQIACLHFLFQGMHPKLQFLFFVFLGIEIACLKNGVVND